MDVALEIMLGAQLLRDECELLHGVVGGTDDAGRQEQPFDVVALVEGEGQIDYLVHREARPAHVRGDAVDAIGAVELAVIGQEDFQKRDAPTVWRIGMTDAAALNRADAFSPERRPLRRRAGGAGCIVLRRVGQNRQLAGQVHLVS